MADMNLYAGSPFETPYERLQRRRAIMQALQEKAMQQHQNEIVSGRVVPFSPLEGLTQLATAYTAGQGQNQLDQQQAQLQQGYQANEADAARQIIDTMLGRGNTSPEGPVQPIAASPDKAALMATTSPYLRNNPALQKVIAAKIATQGTDKQFYTYQIDANGNIVRLPARPGENPSLATMNGTPIEAAKYAYGPNYQAANARQTGQNVSDLTYQPPIAGGKVQAEQNAQMGAPGATKAGVAADVTTATKEAERQAALTAQRPHTEARMESQSTKNKMLDDVISQAEKQANGFTTGFFGGITNWVPGTPAFNLAQTLNTVKANVGFDKLQELRDNAKTGGALGQVSDFENRLLQSVWGALEQSQSKEQFIQNLERVRKQTQASWQRVREAYKKDYGVDYPGATIPTAAGSSPSTERVVDW